MATFKKLPFEKNCHQLNKLDSLAVSQAIMNLPDEITRVAQEKFNFIRVAV